MSSLSLVPSSTSTEEDDADWPVFALEKRRAQRLFERLSNAYGRQFTDFWSSTDPVRLLRDWATELFTFTDGEILRGLSRLSEYQHRPPNLQEFKLLCRPAMDYIAAYFEAIEGIEARNRGEFGTWTHPAIYWTATSLYHELTSEPYASVKMRFEKRLKAELDKREWDAVPPARVLITHDLKKGKPDLSKFHAEMAKLNISNEKRDPLAWARRLVAKAENGEFVRDDFLQQAREVLAHSTL